MLPKKEKSKRVPELGGRELTDLSPDVHTAYTYGWPIGTKSRLCDRLYNTIKIVTGLHSMLTCTALNQALSITQEAWLNV